MYIAGYLASILIGVSLGLIGGGGSILTVPVLVYLFGIDAVLATTYSLFVVGATSIVGSVSYFKKGFVDLKMGFFFGIPSIAAVFLIRHYLLPAIPDELFTVWNFILTKNILLMLLFAVLMIIASISMIRKDVSKELLLAKRIGHTLTTILYGIAVGAVTGLIGAGGGFLIIPVLVNMLKIPMKTAVGTSLFIIGINSSSGFLFSIDSEPIHWPFVLSIAAIAMVGIIIGSSIATKINGKKLKPAFGWFVLVMGIYILAKETIF